jgi:hypothetical protein
VKFRITLHSGFGAPADAIERLWERLGTRREEALFARVGAEIRATWGDPANVSSAHDERAEVARLAVLEIVRRVCERAPELKSDWFAVSLMP